ncbi:hypothetical protein REPUB_Repub05bG0129200 [Reevesia pubescens]
MKSKKLLILHATQTGNALDATEHIAREAEHRACLVMIRSSDNSDAFVAKKLDKRLSDLGATAVVERGLGDDQHPSGVAVGYDKAGVACGGIGRWFRGGGRLLGCWMVADQLYATTHDGGCGGFHPWWLRVNGEEGAMGWWWCAGDRGSWAVGGGASGEEMSWVLGEDEDTLGEGKVVGRLVIFL